MKHFAVVPVKKLVLRIKNISQTKLAVSGHIKLQKNPWPYEDPQKRYMPKWTKHAQQEPRYLTFLTRSMKDKHMKRREETRLINVCG
jgi:hypothetical protein